MTRTAKQHGIIIIGDLVPAHTGKGADFRLAERAYKNYEGLYVMVEIPYEDWELLGAVPEGKDSVNLSLQTVQLLEDKGYIPGPLEVVPFYDPGVKEFSDKPRGKFDLVITSDMFEHVEPEHVRDTIQEVAELTRYTMYNNIACQLTGKPIAEEGPYQGQDMHISVHEPEWWLDEFDLAVPHMSLLQWNSRMRRTKRRPTNQTGYSKRCIMIHERIGAR